MFVSLKICRKGLPSGMLYLTKFNLLIVAKKSCCVPTMAQARVRRSAPTCDICSYRQRPPAQPRLVSHRHNSPREIRIVQGVEYAEQNLPYMCTSCVASHPARSADGLNILVGASNLHDLHNPRDARVRCPPDPIHIDWLTVCGATIPDLQYAWELDYGKSDRPMRILLSAGLNDLARGKSRLAIVASILQFSTVVDRQNLYHPHTKNEFVVATVLNPSKFVWFEDNGPPPPNHQNLLNEIKELNSWIVYFNQQRGKITPRFHRFGVKDGTRRDKDGHYRKVKCHLMDRWRQTDSDRDKLHLNDQWRVRMGIAVTRHFQGEKERFGVLG